jgi:hypothetical protein
MTDDDEFNPSEAAAKATGDLADAGEDDLEDAPAPDPSDDVDEDVQEESDEAESTDSSSAGGIGKYLWPLFTASAAGPTASTLQEEAGLGERIAHVGDGILDYVLHFDERLQDQLEDTLGPAGKIGRGLSGIVDNRGAGGGSEETEQSTDEDDDGGAGGPGVPDGLEGV